jgi:hypothetical protein
MERGFQVEIYSAAQWLKENQKSLFECPRLPGNLRLTPHACSLRYRKANASDFANLERTEWCAIGLKMSLAVCRGCNVGRTHARAKRN